MATPGKVDPAVMQAILTADAAQASIYARVLHQRQQELGKTAALAFTHGDAARISDTIRQGALAGVRVTVRQTPRAGARMVSVEVVPEDRARAGKWGRGTFRIDARLLEAIG